MIIKINKQYALFLVLFYLLIFNEPLTRWIPVLQYQDEILALLAIPLMIYRICTDRVARGFTGIVAWLSGFVLFTLLGTIYFHYQPFKEVAIQDMLLCLKFWMVLYLGKELFRNLDLERFGSRLCGHVKMITLVLFTLSALNMVVEIFPPFDERYGLGANMLFFDHPVSLASVCIALAVILIAFQNKIRLSGLYIGLLALTMVTTLRSKAWANGLVLLALHFIVNMRQRKFSIRTLLPLIPVALAIGWDQIQYYFVDEADESARSALMQTSIQVANDHFPLGAGFGTYGSHYSQVVYSPLYYRYGLNEIWGLSESNSGFICDTFWPMILGQSGYLGTACYIGALVTLVRKLSKLRSVNVFYYASGFAAVACLLVDSTAAIIFAHPLSMPLALWLGILLCRAPKNRSLQT